MHGGACGLFFILFFLNLNKIHFIKCLKLYHPVICQCSKLPKQIVIGGFIIIEEIKLFAFTVFGALFTKEVEINIQIENKNIILICLYITISDIFQS